MQRTEKKKKVFLKDGVFDLMDFIVIFHKYIRIRLNLYYNLAIG